MSKPKIRFKGYCNDWERRKLGDIYGSIGNAFVGTATPYYAEHGHFYLESNNVKDGQINHNAEIFINDEFYEKQKDKWLHTGDMGIIDQDGYLFIKGRCKNMILSSNGQNIYPEEIEDKLNNMPYISESIVIEKEGKLVALIYPDFDLVNEEKITDEKLDELMTANLKEINQQLPAYSQLNTYKLYNEEFEKTPKRSIKRFLYQ